MCLIVYAPEKKLIVSETLRSAHRNNPHGFGIVFAQDGRLLYHKRLASFETFQAVFDLVPEDKPCAIHFRWKTHGEISDENIHPFELLNKDKGHPTDLCFMHNGVIQGTFALEKPGKDPRSDTHLYVDEILRPLCISYPDVIYDKPFRTLVERDVGSGNKFLAMDGDGEVILFNEKSWHKDEKKAPGVYYSNSYTLNDWDYRKNKNNYSYDYKDYMGGHGWPHNNSSSGDSSKSKEIVPVKVASHASDKPSGTGYSYGNTYTYEIPDILPKAIKDLLKQDEVLLCHIDNNPNFGFGWVRNVSKNSQRHDDKIAHLHRLWVNTRDAMKAALGTKEPEKKETLVTQEETKEATNVVSIESKLAQGELELTKELNSKLNTQEFRIMTQNQILEWIMEFPKETSEWLSKNGFFGSPKGIEEWLQSGEWDKACEYVYRKTHGGDLGKINLPSKFQDTPSSDDDMHEQIYAWHGH